MVSTQHAPDINLKELLAPDIKDYVVDPVVAALELDTSNYRLLVNPTGRFEVGGPMGDAGLTGRKIIIDTYGGMARHGGGAFSGKDPSKVDRSAAYAMRWVAKNVVAAGLAERCETQVAYAIGKAKPVGLFVECFGTEQVPVERIEDAVLEVFDLRPRAIISVLDLRVPSTRRPPPLVTSAAPTRTSPGSAPTASSSSGPRPACRSGTGHRAQGPGLPDPFRRAVPRLSLHCPGPLPAGSVPAACPGLLRVCPRSLPAGSDPAAAPAPARLPGTRCAAHRDSERTSRYALMRASFSGALIRFCSTRHFVS